MTGVFHGTGMFVYIGRSLVVDVRISDYVCWPTTPADSETAVWRDNWMHADRCDPSQLRQVMPTSVVIHPPHTIENVSHLLRLICNTSSTSCKPFVASFLLVDCGALGLQSQYMTRRDLSSLR